VARDIVAFGLYPDRPTLEAGLENLKSAGFRASDISVVFPDTGTSRQLAHELHTKAPEGAATGGGTGAALGGALGWLVGIGAITIPGIGPLVAAGPIVAALAGAGALGATGGLIGALVGAGIPEVEAKRYEGRIRKGGILCSVHCDDRDWADRAKEILRTTGGQDVATTAEATADYRP
jgi:hypothetical protein